MQFFENDFYGILPELFLLGASLTLLMFGVIYSSSPVFGAPSLMKITSWLSILSLILTLGLVVNNSMPSMVLCTQNLFIDSFTDFFKLLILVGSIISILVSFQYFKTEKMANFEYLILILLSISFIFLSIKFLYF